MDVTLFVTLGNPDQQAPTRDESSQRMRNIYQKVQEMVQDIEGGLGDDTYQWEYLKALFLRLHARNKLSQKEKDLMALVEPVILKYVEYDPQLAAKIDGHKLNRHHGE
jgi:hypothetical protein